jgi:hypothetical protein
VGNDSALEYIKGDHSNEKADQSQGPFNNRTGKMTNMDLAGDETGVRGDEEEMTSLKEVNMKYKVHRLDIIMENGQSQLEQFLNNLEGEVVTIIPNIKKTSLSQIYGATAKVNFLLIVEKIK